MEKNRLLPKCQSGFRKGRSCTENLVKISSHVKRAMMRRRPVLATFYDIKRAYDTVWHSKLLQKLYKLGVSKNMYSFFQSFLKDRVIRVKVGSVSSEAYRLDMGIPQGSIVAPLAFSIMLYDIDKLKLERATMSLYADDLAMWSTARYRRTYINYFYNIELKTFQGNVNLIVQYMENNGFALAPEKTVFMIFTSGKINERASIHIKNTEIKPSKEVKYLGVILDQTLTFRSHINHLVKKTRKNLNLIKILKKENGLNDIKLMRNLILSLVRSRLTYGQEIFYSAPLSYLNLLQRTETSIIKTIFNIPKTANPLLVYREVGMKPLSFSRKLQATKSGYRLNCVENDVEEEIKYDFNNCNTGFAQSTRIRRPKVFKKCISLNHYSQSLVTEANVEDWELVVIPQSQYPAPPWEEADIQISSSLGDYNKSTDINLLTIAAKETIHKLSDHLLVYTDGSLGNQGQTGCSFVIPELKVAQGFKLNSGISIYSAELFAIEQAVSYIYHSTNHPRICILTDSKSSLQAIQNRSPNRIDSILYILETIYKMKKSGREVSLQWIPSHTGIKGNDMADIVAKRAANSTNLPLTDISYTLSEISAKLTKANDTMWQKDFSKYAKDLDWPDPEKVYIPFLKAPPKFLNIFLRLRCKSTRFDIYQVDCCCTEASFSVEHIFSCKRIFDQLLLTRTFCSRENVNFSYSSVMSHHHVLGWEPAKIFINELMLSEVGHLL